MFRLALIVYLFIGTTLGGSAMVAALTMGMDTTQPIVIAALLGFLVAIPVAYVVAKMITENA